MTNSKEDPCHRVSFSHCVLSKECIPQGSLSFGTGAKLTYFEKVCSGYKVEGYCDVGSIGKLLVGRLDKRIEIGS